MIVVHSLYIVYSILLGPPGRAQVFPYLSPGPLDLWWYETMNGTATKRSITQRLCHLT